MKFHGDTHTTKLMGRCGELNLRLKIQETKTHTLSLPECFFLFGPFLCFSSPTNIKVPTSCGWKFDSTATSCHSSKEQHNCDTPKQLPTKYICQRLEILLNIEKFK